MRSPTFVVLATVVFMLSCSAAELPVDVLIGGGAGSYDVKRWKQDWPGCKFEDGVAEGHATVVEDSGRNWLRVTCASNQIGPEKGGVGWRWPFEAKEHVELSYLVRFSEDFEFVKGGKLPGLCGGPESVTGGRPANGVNGFSARIMWRRDGRGEAYVYHMNQPDKYGESFPFPEDFRFPLGEPIQIFLRVAMNAPGYSDGSIQVLVRRSHESVPIKVLERKDIRWRSQKSFAVDSLLCEVFHGGSDPSWAPKKACAVDLAGFRLGVPEKSVQSK